MTRHADRSACRLLLAGMAMIIAVLASDSGAAQSPQPPGRKYQEWLYFHQPRAYPGDTIPSGAYAAARQQYMRAFGRVPGQAAPAINQNTWNPIGPAPITNTGWNPTNSGQFNQSGRINSIAINPSNPNVIYIGAATGGVWKTTDGGTTWSPLTDNQCSLAMGSVVLDPSNPNVVYAGTGEENFSLDSYYGCGVLKSPDGGATWTQLGASIFQTSSGGATIGKIAIHPTTTSTLLVASDFGLYRSTDGGTNFTLVQAGVATDIVIDPGNPSTMYAAIGNIFGAAANGVYKSTDTGATWSKLAGGFPTVNVGRINLAIAASAPSTVFAAVQDSSTFGFLGLFVTNNGGTSWTQLAATGADCDGQCWYDMGVAVDPTDPTIVYFSGLSLYRSTNGGANFSNIGGTTRCEVLHCDHHAFAFQPGTPTTIYDGNDGGIYKSTDSGLGASWTTLNTNLAISQFYPGFIPHPTNANIAFGGTQDNGNVLYTGTSAWTSLPPYGDGGFTAIDFNNANTAYSSGDSCGAGCGPYRSDNFNLGAASTWNEKAAGINLNDRQLFIPPMVMSPSNSQTLYFGTFRIYKTTNRGDAWDLISPDLTKGACNFAGNCSISAIVEAKANSQVLYVGASDGNVQVTQNGGTSWTPIITGLPNRAVTYLAVDPTNAQNAFVTFSGFGTGHVFKTTNGGTGWTDISGNLPNIPVNTILLDPGAPTTNIYIGTDLGAFQTTNGGTSWTPFDTGLPQVPVLDLVFNAGTNVLMAATHGRGAFNATFVAPPPPPVLAVAPATDMVSSGQQGGPFSPASFQYQLSATTGTVGYSISGLPTWLTASSTSGTVGTTATTITFTVNASANSLTPATYGPATITFTNTTNGLGNTTRTATLTVTPAPALVVTPAANIVSSGTQGGPFSPSSFQYQLSATVGTLSYSISGLPSWLTASSTSGTVGTSGATVTFTVNASANSLTAGTYGPTTITFTNATNGQGNTTRTATLTVNVPPPSGGSCTLASQLGDLDGNRDDDLVFRRGDGLLSVLLMNGPAVASAQVIGTVDPRFTLLAVADFNGDGRADLLFRRASDGMLAMYLMNGATVISATFLGTLGTDWDFAGAADFDGDGRADMLFRRNTDGLLGLYLMNGATIVAAQQLGAVGIDWRIRGVRDVNGDGRADILFRRASDGALALYEFNGFQLLAAQLLGVVGPAFDVIGVRDFNGDGRADILFRRSDGMLAMFLMNGFTVLASQVLGVVGPDIVVLGLGDFNGDGRADLAFRRVSDGLMAIYLMNGFQILSITSLGTVGTEFSACYGQPPFAVAQAPASRTRIGGL
jgi:photosystem II stability/assembly factor-like uncharacterized protein